MAQAGLPRHDVADGAAEDFAVDLVANLGRELREERGLFLACLARIGIVRACWLTVRLQRLPRARGQRFEKSGHILRSAC